MYPDINLLYGSGGYLKIGSYSGGKGKEGGKERGKGERRPEPIEYSKHL
jgi:hypothetical protein